ncbi:hypothetical protein EUZ93_01585 [Wolbachia pipientis]|nr:hypothetical protein [Wolbachia pipientis]
MTSSNFSEAAAFVDAFSVDNISLSGREKNLLDNLMAEHGSHRRDQNKDNHAELYSPSASGDLSVGAQLPMEVDVERVKRKRASHAGESNENMVKHKIKVTDANSSPSAVNKSNNVSTGNTPMAGDFNKVIYSRAISLVKNIITISVTTSTVNSRYYQLLLH